MPHARLGAHFLTEYRVLGVSFPAHHHLQVSKGRSQVRGQITLWAKGTEREPLFNCSQVVKM